jgi:hypothetical protein
MSFVAANISAPLNKGVREWRHKVGILELSLKVTGGLRDGTRNLIISDFNKS